MTNVVAIVGCGAIGFRHFQGALQSKLCDRVYVVDPSVDSQRRCQNYADELGCSKNVICLPSLEQLPSVINILIVATASNNRLDLLESLSRITRCNTLILEKLVFSRVNEFDEGAKLISRLSENCYVNCSKRLLKSSLNIKDFVRGSDFVMSVVGGSWDMACNGIHYLDLFSYLIGDRETIEYRNIDFNKIIPSKRIPYSEVLGEMVFNSERSTLVMTCLADDSPLITGIELLNGQAFVQIDEQNKLADWTIDGFTEKKEFEILFQSELTGPLITQLIESGGTCELPPFSVSSRLHIPFLNALYEGSSHLLGGSHDLCFT